MLYVFLKKYKYILEKNILIYFIIIYNKFNIKIAGDIL